jgi:hypothetical protein
MMNLGTGHRTVLPDKFNGNTEFYIRLVRFAFLTYIALRSNRACCAVFPEIPAEEDLIFCRSGMALARPVLCASFSMTCLRVEAGIFAVQ